MTTTERQLDYDKAVKRLQKHPDQIQKAWLHWDEHPAGKIFRKISLEPNTTSRSGCLTQLRALDREGMWALGGDGLPDLFLTEAIHNDDRIPAKISNVTPEILPLFAEWQKAVDEYWITGELNIP